MPPPALRVNVDAPVPELLKGPEPVTKPPSVTLPAPLESVIEPPVIAPAAALVMPNPVTETTPEPALRALLSVTRPG